MQVPTWTKSGILGAVAGAVAITLLGFSSLGWTTAGAANRITKLRIDGAVIASFVPFCISKAHRDADETKLIKFGAERSADGRSQFVSDSGWATMPGMSAPNPELALACASQLPVPKA